MKKPRLLFLSRSLEVGGAERQMVVLLRELHRRGHTVAVAVFYGGGPLQEELVSSGIPVFTLEKKSRWDFAGFLYRWIRLLHTFRPGVVHSYVVGPNIIAVSAKVFRPGTRVIWGIRDAFQSLDSYGRFAGWSFRVQKALARLADSAVANSEAGARALRLAGFSLKDLRVIPNGIDTDRFFPDGRAGKHFREQLDIDAHCTLIGIVGRLDPVKGHELFIQAAARVSPVHPNVRFLILGNGPDARKQRLIRLADELGILHKVIWSNARLDMPAAMNALDILVSCSHSEGFPNVVAEALACNVYCVVSDVGDSRVLVEQCGTVVPPDDCEALANGCFEAIAKRLQTAPDSRNRIVQRYGIDKLGDRSEEVLCFTH